MAMAERSTDTEPPGSRNGRGSAAGALRAAVELHDPRGLLAAPARAELERRAREAMALLPAGAGGEVRVRIVDDAEMSAAHERYSKIAGTTDVLTFDLTEGGSARGEPLDVDILVCVDEAARQGAMRGHPAERELLLYIVHGVLHCLGHDDHDDGAYARMHALEDEILEAIGVGRTFDREAPRRHGEHGGKTEQRAESASVCGEVEHAAERNQTTPLTSFRPSSPCPPCLRGEQACKETA